MNGNPLQMLKNMKNVMNPQQMVTNMLSKINNPMINNLVQMAQSGDTEGVEKFARNICQEKGIDFDKQFSEFMGDFKK